MGELQSFDQIKHFNLLLIQQKLLYLIKIAKFFLMINHFTTYLNAINYQLQMECFLFEYFRMMEIYKLILYYFFHLIVFLF